MTDLGRRLNIVHTVFRKLCHLHNCNDFSIGWNKKLSVLPPGILYASIRSKFFGDNVYEANIDVVRKLVVVCRLT